MIDLQNSYFTILFGGIAIFMYGMTIASQALEKMMANRASQLMNKLGDSQMLAIVVGISLTTILQSSGAVTSMLVGLGSAQVINLSQVMGVIIGTAVGSTLTVQLISLNLTQYALPVIILSFTIFFLSKKPGLKNFSLVGLGFGMLFFGLGMISNSAHHFANLPEMTQFMKPLKENAYISLWISLIFCALVHSSAVTIGLAMSLASAGVITLNEAMFWVYGANIGTTSTALIASIGSNHIGKQVAWAHFFYKTLSVGVFLLGYVHVNFIALLNYFHLPTNRAIANGHLLFNLISAALFFPFIQVGARWIEKLFPKDPKEDFRAEFLSLNNYESTALALSYAHREIQRTSDIVLGMIEDSIKLFRSYDPDLIDSIRERDNKVDYLYCETKMFLVDHASKTSSTVHQDITYMILFLSNLERAADSIDLNLIALAVKKNALKLEFSAEGWQELQDMHASLMKVAMMGISSYKNKELSENAIQLKRSFSKLEVELREHHIERLNRGLSESIKTSSIHLDLLSELKHIGSLLCSHAYNISSDRR